MYMTRIERLLFGLEPTGMERLQDELRDAHFQNLEDRIYYDEQLTPKMPPVSPKIDL